MENEKFDFHEIKTFEDACRRLGFSAETFLILAYTGDTEAFLRANAFYKLMIIQKAINNGVWCDEEGWSYYPFWLFYSNEKKRNARLRKRRELMLDIFPPMFLRIIRGIPMFTV